MMYHFYILNFQSTQAKSATPWFTWYSEHILLLKFNFIDSKFQWWNSWRRLRRHWRWEEEEEECAWMSRCTQFLRKLCWKIWRDRLLSSWSSTFPSLLLYQITSELNLENFRINSRKLCWRIWRGHRPSCSSTFPTFLLNQNLSRPISRPGHFWANNQLMASGTPHFTSASYVSLESETGYLPFHKDHHHLYTKQSQEWEIIPVPPPWLTITSFK